MRHLLSRTQVGLCLRNRDRVSIIWPLVHEYLAACTAPEAAQVGTERAL